MVFSVIGSNVVERLKLIQTQCLSHLRMSRLVFQIIAGFALGSAVLLLLMGAFVVLRFPPHSPWEVIPGFAVIGLLASAGAGLLELRKWAAVMISLIALYPVYWELKDAFHPVPGYANWLGFVFAALLLIPSIWTAVYWRTLTWRRVSSDSLAANHR